MERRTQNISLWNRNAKLCDNGVLSTGTVFRILALHPIESLMAGDIHLISMKFSVAIMKSPRYYKQLFINYQVQGDN